MNWIKPIYNSKQIDNAGRILIDQDLENSDSYNNALEILNNFRSAHAFPLNTIQIFLRRISNTVDNKALIAQRLKKLSSILYKLQRFERMELSRMQDIGGCRAIVSKINHIDQIKKLFTESRIRHRFINQKDYILNPKESGYRGVHLVYRYISDRNSTYNNLLIEVQIRTKLQHIWATTVETMGVFIDHSLKSSEGPEDWLRFFSLISSVFAIEEKCKVIPNTSSNLSELKKEIQELCKKHQILKKLNSYKIIARHIDTESSKKNQYYLLQLLHNDNSINLSQFDKSKLEEATNQYLRLEKKAKENNYDVVLVSSDSIDNIKSAYPNYFLDTHDFSKRLISFLK